MGAYPPALSEIVLRALAPEPDDRFQTMQELQIALESFARASGVALSTVALASYVQELFADELAAWRAAQQRRQVAGRSPGGQAGRRRVGGSRRSHRDRRVRDAPDGARKQATSRTRALRAALAAFVALCAVAGALATKHWRTDGAGDAQRGRARRRRKRSAVGGAGRGKESGHRTDRGKNLPSTTVMPAVAANPRHHDSARPRPTKTKAKAR